MPAEFLNQHRWFSVNDNKTPKIKGWQNPVNQKNYDDCALPVAFCISSSDLDGINYLAFDFDHVITDDGKWVNDRAKKAFEQIMRRTGKTYVERSQSGNGIHIFAVPSPNLFPKMAAGPNSLPLDNREDLDMKKRAKLELFYMSPHYFIPTGNMLTQCGKEIVRGANVDNAVNYVLDEIQQYNQRKKETSKTNETPQPVQTDLEKQPIDIKQVEEMLKFIDPAQLDYTEWLNVGIILKNIGAPFELWDEWSMQDPERYNPKGDQTCEQKWAGFTENGPLGMGTLVMMAKEYGYHPEPKAEAPRPVESSNPIKSAKTLNMGTYLDSEYFSDLQDFRSIRKIKTGFKSWDDAIDGVGPGLYVIGAIPSLGKTTLMHQMADNMVAAGEHVIYFSLEQSELELASKSIARQSYRLHPENALSEWAVQCGSKDAEKQKLAREAIEEYRKSIGNRLTIVPGIFNVSIDDIKKIVEDYISTTGKRPVLVIDYLQKISAGTNMTDKQRIDYVTAELKRIQSKHKLAIFCICSFNRSNYLQQVDFESFKESGDIEYSADAVWALQLSVMNTDDMMAPDSGKGCVTKSRKRDLVEAAKKESPRRIELKALKHRGHQLYSVFFNFHCAYAYFEVNEKASSNRKKNSNIEVR